MVNDSYVVLKWFNVEFFKYRIDIFDDQNILNQWV